MTILDFDEEQAGLIDTMYATPDVVAQRQFVLGLLDLKPGERVLDIGSGPGYLISEMGAAVGRDGAVHGLDASVAMNAIAARRCTDKPWVHIDEGDVLELPYADGAFDAAVSTQVYEYVADLPRALDELHRVLRPGGRVLILDTDWDSLVWHASDRELHRRITAAWEEPPGASAPAQGARQTDAGRRLHRDRAAGARAVQHRAHRELVQCVRHARGREIRARPSRPDRGGCRRLGWPTCRPAATRTSSSTA